MADMPKTTKSLAAVCPDCGATITFTAQPKFEQVVVCKFCDAMLEVVSVNPIELDWVYEDEDYEYDEDYDDYDDDDDDDDDDFDDDFEDYDDDDYVEYDDDDD